MIPFFFHIHRNHHSSRLTSSFVVMETKPLGRDVVEHPGGSGCTSSPACPGTVLGTGAVGYPGGCNTPHSEWGRRAAGSALVPWCLSNPEPSHLDRLGERPRAAPPALRGRQEGAAAPSTLCRAPAASQDTRPRHGPKHLSMLEEPSRTWCCLQPRAPIPSWNWPAKGLSSGISLY